MRTDQAKALQLFNEGAPGFREADLYPYCGDARRRVHRPPRTRRHEHARPARQARQPLGQWLYETAKEDEIGRVTYFWPRPGSTEILQKVALVTRVGDQVCAVGYYRPGHRGKETIP